MSADTIQDAMPLSDFFPPEIRADMDAVAEALSSGKPLDPEVARRVRERGKIARKNLAAVRGVQDIGVQIIRELRGELPSP